MRKDSPQFFYRMEITTWQEEEGREEWLTYTREFKSHDLSISQKEALNAWNQQLQAFEKGEIIPGFLGPKDSEGNEWNWLEKAEAELMFIDSDGDKELAYHLTGGTETDNIAGRACEQYALRTLGFKCKGIFD